MGYHRIPPIATRLRINRGFDSAWYASPTSPSYARLLQKDWMLSKLVWSFVSRSSRTTPRTQLTREQQLQQLTETRRFMEGGGKATMAAEGEVTSSRAALKEYANFRTSRVFLQHLPYKFSIKR